MHQLERGRGVILAALAMLTVYLAGLALFWNDNRAIADENALMENLQAGGLAVACVLLIPCLFRSVVGISRFASWSLLLVLISMLLREVDVETLSVPTAIVAVGSGAGRNLILGFAFIVTAVVFVQRRYELTGQLIRFAFSRIGVLLALGCALYALSLPFDKSLLGLSVDSNRFCEEAVECGATLMFLVASAVNLIQFTAALRTKPATKPTPITASRMAA